MSEIQRKIEKSKTAKIDNEQHIQKMLLPTKKRVPNYVARRGDFGDDYRDYEEKENQQ